MLTISGMNALKPEAVVFDELSNENKRFKFLL